jgi:6-phosphogluconolactonase
VEIPLVEVFPSREELMGRAASLFAEIASGCVAERGRFTVALSGGSTPRRLFALLSEEQVRSTIAWGRVEVFWGDERCVPPDDERSNYLMAHRSLLKSVPARIHRIEGEAGPGEAASRYEETLRRVFRLQEGQVPSLDLILLGMGADGHTASLFPGSAVLEERSRLVAPVLGVDPPRVTLTLPVINEAERVIFLVSGEEKAGPVHHILREGNAEGYPAGMVAPGGELFWLLDEGAASLLGE